MFPPLVLSSVTLVGGLFPEVIPAGLCVSYLCTENAFSPAVEFIHTELVINTYLNGLRVELCVPGVTGVLRTELKHPDLQVRQ